MRPIAEELRRRYREAMDDHSQRSWLNLVALVHDSASALSEAEQELQQARKRLDELAAESQWRPIESAPLTHDVLLFCVSRNDEVKYCCIDAADSDGFFIEQASHWMPLPPAPKESDDAGT